MRIITHTLSLFLLFTVAALNVQCKSINKTEKQIVKVDFDFSGRRIQEVNDPLYESWVIEEKKEDAKTFNGVTFNVRGNFFSKWVKVTMNAPYYARLVSDGLASEESVVLTISGLQAGEHSLLTYHNTFDNLAGKTLSPIKIYVNNQLEATVSPSNRALSKIEAGTAYVTFNATGNSDVVIRFEVDSDSGNSSLVINGFELDTPDIKKQAHSPQPENTDEHVVVNDKLQLEWKSSEDAVAHHLYFGEDETSVINADPSSSTYKGKLTKNIFPVTDLYSMKTYYWRVDQADKDGKLTLGNVWSFKPAQLAFPGAEGYGRYAIGGRGGKVVTVTNLNDDGPGSFRDAVNQDIGPRTIVFNVSGNIELKSRLVINHPYITVAGQTAPGEGITITRAPVGLTGNDGVVRFLRVRIGSGTTFDGMGLTGANHSIMDHCSISWTIDESFSSRGAHNITLQRTLISEALNVADHNKYEAGKMHGYAATIGGDIGSFHHNLLAHNYGRNWSIGGGLNGDGFYSGKIDIRNNVVYNWGGRVTDGGANQVNFVNNYYKPGPSSHVFYALKAEHEGVGKGKQQYFFAGNVMPGHFDETNQDKGRIAKLTNGAVVDYETFLDEPFFESYVTTQTATQAYKNVVSDVGATQPFLSDYDSRIINETLQGSYTYKGTKSGLPGMIDTELDAGGFPIYAGETRPSNWDTDHDGLPDWWEEVHGLNTQSAPNDFSDANNDSDKDGFTQLDDYLDWMAQPHFFISLQDSLEFSLKELFKGYFNQPVYSFFDESNGKVSLVEDQLKFIPEQTGLASIKIKVRDAEGDSMIRQVNIYIN